MAVGQAVSVVMKQVVPLGKIVPVRRVVSSLALSPRWNQKWLLLTDSPGSNDFPMGLHREASEVEQRPET